MKKLTESDIIRIMREEWNAKLESLSENADVVLKGKIDGRQKTLISPGLKLKHKKSKFEYPVISVGTREVTLNTPEGVPFVVDIDTLEKEYELD